jgi:cell division protein FtsI (penicillin-binding protein 3)
MAAAGAILCFLGGVVISSGFGIMVQDGPAWSQQAERQRDRQLRLAAKRGSVYDRHGAALAVSVEVPSVSLDATELLRQVPPHRVAEVARGSADRIAEALGLEPATVESKILRRRPFAWLKHRIDARQAEAIRRLAEPADGQQPVNGLRIDGENQRYYPGRGLAGPLLGFVSPDGAGKEGLELGLDRDLAGHPEVLKGLRDRNGRVLLLEGLADERSAAGQDLFLTLDSALQVSVEEELQRALQTFEARSASAVVVVPETGELLAFASVPGYNPNDYRKSEPAERRLRPTADTFEPGSTLKIFTVAAALEAGVTQATERMNCHNGVFFVDGVRIPDTHPAGELTLSQVLAYSSNICAAQLALRLGNERLHGAFERFGFGTATGLPVPGEASGVLLPRKRPWLPSETAIAGFGHGLTVTNLQLGLATAALANGGRLMKPILVRRAQTATGEVLFEAQPEVRRQVVSERVARTVTELMVAVTEDGGTGTQAAVPGYWVAGKTGTAQKVDSERGGYSQTAYVAAFVGFVPAEHPAVAIAVTFDEPRLEHKGGAVAAPVFRRIAQAALWQLGIAPRQAPVADLTEPRQAAQNATLQKLARARPNESQREKAPNASSVRVPDLAGWPVREAIRRSVELGVLPEVRGSGLLARQTPPAGAWMQPGQKLVLVFEPAT